MLFQGLVNGFHEPPLPTNAGRPNPVRVANDLEESEGSCLPAAQDPVLATANGDALGVEVLQKGNGVLPRHAEELFEIARRDLFLLPEERHEALLRGLEGIRVEEQAVLDPDQLLLVQQELDQLARGLLVQIDRVPATVQANIRAGVARARRPESGRGRPPRGTQ